MKTRSRLLRWIAPAMLLLQFAGCQQILVDSLASGLREGLAAVATGLIDGSVNTLFGLEDGAALLEALVGNDLFIRI